MSTIKFLKKWFYDIDHYTLFFVFSLMFVGMISSLTISPAMGHRINIGNYHFAIHQIIFYIFGTIIMLFCSMLLKSSILNISYISYFACLIMLCAVLIIGSSIKGSCRWISLGFFSLQPSEIMKPFFIIVNSSLMSISRKNNLFPTISVASFGFLILLFILQPDFGSALIYSLIWFAQVFLGSTHLKVLVYSVVPASLSIVTIGFLFFPHFHYRIMNFLVSRSGNEQYQTKKAIESIYNGGFFGKGLGEGEVKYQLPDAHTDYIFSVICEEFGNIFSIFLILYFLCFMYRHLASNLVKKRYEIRVIYGIVLLFMAQSYMHIAVNMHIFPSKGMTLPFISYGGSSILANSIMFGFLLAFTRKDYIYKSPYNFFENAYSGK